MELRSDGEGFIRLWVSAAADKYSFSRNLPLRRISENEIRDSGTETFNVRALLSHFTNPVHPQILKIVMRTIFGMKREEAKARTLTVRIQTQSSRGQMAKRLGAKKGIEFYYNSADKGGSAPKALA